MYRYTKKFKRTVMKQTIGVIISLLSEYSQNNDSYNVALYLQYEERINYYYHTHYAVCGLHR
jgi:hypothetical protein